MLFTGANQISVSDVDAGMGIEQVTLTVTSGTLTLGSTVGLSLVSGNGTSSITIQGTLTTLNNALNGLLFTGSPATLTVTADDLGSTGSGGPLADTLTLAIL